MSTTTTDLFDSPIGETVEALQDEGRDVWVWGWSADGSQALIVDGDRDAVSVAQAQHLASLGRWECTPAHLRANVDLYQQRFGRRG